jgi:hypothetical protein
MAMDPAGGAHDAPPVLRPGFAAPVAAATMAAVVIIAFVDTPVVLAIHVCPFCLRVS